MAMIDIKLDPTKRDLQVFALLFALFEALLGWLATGKPAALLGAAIFTGSCFLISLAFNREHPVRRQFLGVIIPLVLLAIWALERQEIAPRAIMATLIGIGVVGGLLTLIFSGLGRRLYVGWMFAAMPIGWTVSHALLAVVYYGVFTPIGLIMRLCGYDPMQRKLDPGVSTYWIEHRPPDDPKRYFRQF